MTAKLLSAFDALTNAVFATFKKVVKIALLAALIAWGFLATLIIIADGLM